MVRRGMARQGHKVTKGEITAMRVDVQLKGTTPLLMHNSQLADPDNEWTKAIDRINAKAKNMTEDDRREKARLQWFGGLYVSHNGTPGPVIPTANLRRCFQEAAKATKEGKTITRAVVPNDLEVPLLYDGPRDVQELFKLPHFVHTTMVGINRGKVQGTRPIFPHWEVRCRFELVTELLDFDGFVEIVRRAGITEGLGDNRINGFGRFEAKVIKA
jgi:hypothetical protein